MSVVAAPPRVMNRSPRAIAVVRTSNRLWHVSCAFLATTMLLWWAIVGLSEEWWLTAVLTYLPRVPWLFPPAVLAVACLFGQPRALVINLLSILVVAGPVMGFNLPLSRWLVETAPVDSQRSLRVVTCNVQMYKPNFPEVVTEIQRLKPDLILLQEARGNPTVLKQAFADWHILHQDFYLVASRYPITAVALLDTEVFDRTSGQMVTVAHPAGDIVVANLHQMTARRGLQLLSLEGVISGDDLNRFHEFQSLRRHEAGELRSLVEQHRANLPLIVAGDMNTTAGSSLLSAYWGDLTNTFAAAGIGYGYTSPVRSHNFWPDRCPWARIDHIFCSPEFVVHSAAAGVGAGSDHHLVTAEISLPAR